MSYDNLLYEAYGYHLDETDDQLRRLERDDKTTGSKLTSAFLKLLRYQFRHGVDTPDLLYEEYLKRLIYAVENLPRFHFIYSYATDGSVSVEGTSGDARMNVYFHPRSNKRPNRSYLRVSLLNTPHGSAAALIQLTTHRSGELVVSSPRAHITVSRHTSGDVPYTSARELIQAAEDLLEFAINSDG